MQMKQMPLLNYQILATTKEVEFAQRVRKAITLSKSPTTAADNSSAQRAECLPKPTVKHTGLQTSSRETEAEFNLPDEDRVLRELIIGQKRCPLCGRFPNLIRKRQKGVRNLYRVGCPHRLNPKNNWVDPWMEHCPEPTPWLDSSAAAIRIWTITQKLTQL